jgi:hypothetical protein
MKYFITKKNFSLLFFILFGILSSGSLLLCISLFPFINSKAGLIIKMAIIYNSIAYCISSRLSYEYYKQYDCLNNITKNLKRLGFKY